MIVQAGANAPETAAALEILCRRYWYPLYAFARRQGRPHHEAEDSTQEFLARMLAADAFARVRPERGRFRSFLLAAYRNYLVNEWESARAAKRGGGIAPVSLDAQQVEKRFAEEPIEPGLSPEQAFDQTWAKGLITAAVTSLAGEYERRGQAAVFAALVPMIWSADPNLPLGESAARVGVTPHAFTMALQRLRRRVGIRLREQVAETVTDSDDVEAELRHLIAAISGSTVGA